MHSISIIFLIYIFFALVTLFLWHTNERNPVSGDEPHYLVMSSGIVKHGTLELTEPYKEEFKTREIYKYGLAPEDAHPDPGNTHAVLGPNGLFSVHNVGFPILLAVPFMFGGIVGAKLFMVFFSGLVVVVVWKVSACFSDNSTHRFWAVIGAAVSLPFIPASNQIYPGVLAGLISLTGLYWFLTAHKHRARDIEVLLALTIVFLPWLQIKFAATCLVLVLAISAKIYLGSRDTRRSLQILIIAGASFVALALYNFYAFGKVSGPYQSGALEISKTSLMVLLGLHFDQNEGFLLQSPINLIGVLSFGWFYRFNRMFAIVWALVFLSLIVPNALHPNWYGRLSFSGRFGWPAAVVFIIPTVYGLLAIGRNSEKIFRVIIAGGVLLQLYLFYRYAVVGVGLENKVSWTWSGSYSIFYYPLDFWMPMLYDSSWAYGHGPNYAWLISIFGLLVIGFLSNEKISRRLPVIICPFLALVLLVGFFNNRQSEEGVFLAAQLPSQAGRIENSNRFAEQDADDPGYINYGPYVFLGRGRYEVVLTYRSTGEASEAIGWFDVYGGASGSQLSKTVIHGTANVTREIVLRFESTQWKRGLFEFRTHWNGLSDIEVQNIVLRSL